MRDHNATAVRPGAEEHELRGDAAITASRPRGDPAELPSSERVYRGLREQILNGKMEPGSRLVELQIASQFGVSRTPVREALQRLTSEGLASMEPLRGMVVRTVDAQQIEDIYEIREVLEGLAARLAALRANEGDLAKLRLLTEMMEESARFQRWEALVQANIKFHEVICGASGNERLAQMARSLQEFVRQSSSGAFANAGRVDEVLKEHTEIVAALEEHDPEHAESAARKHLFEARCDLAQRYSGPAPVL